MLCYICGDNTDKSPTDEHIIYNAIGGREKSRGLLCNTCNRKMGSLVDVNFLRQFTVISALLDIKKERGHHKSISVTGSESGNKYLFDAKKEKFQLPYPNIGIKKNDENREANLLIVASSEKHVKQSLKGLKRQFPNLNIEQFMAGFRNQKKKIDEPVTFQTELITEKSYQGATRVAVNIALHLGLAVEQLAPAIKFIKSGKKDDNFQIMPLYKQGYRLNNQPQKAVFHTVVIIGDQKEKKLIAIAEFFNAYRYIILLNSEYMGETLSISYSIDAETGEKNNCRATYTGNIKAAIILFYEERDREFEIDEMNTLMNLAFERYRRRVELGKIISEYFEQYAPNGLLEEQIPHFSSFITQVLVHRKFIQIKGMPQSFNDYDFFSLKSNQKNNLSQ